MVRAVPVLVSAASVPANDLKELLAYIKARPGQLSFASYSAGTSSHYAGMILNQKAGLDLQHVPFQGSPPALVQLMAGQPVIMFDGIATSLPLIKGGKLRVYGVANKQRSAHLPQVPTLAEQGLPDIDFSNWIGVVTSVGVPGAVLDKMNAVLLSVARSPKVNDRLVAAGFEPSDGQSVDQLTQSTRQEFERNAGIVKAFDIQLNQ
jgi:tripartite-type tricarboxylate transporter receptor subunit TctC